MSFASFGTRRRSPSSFIWKILCRSGVLAFGSHSDFLLGVLIAKQQKARWLVLLPTSTLRVQLMYPNGQRVSPADIKAALRTLADPKIGASVALRLGANAAVPPAAQARTERTAAAAAVSVGVSPAFRQAGVVAPPDSPDFGNALLGATVFGKP